MNITTFTYMYMYTVNRVDFGHAKKLYSLFYILLPPTYMYVFQEYLYDLLRQYINIINDYNLLL